MKLKLSHLIALTKVATEAAQQSGDLIQSYADKIIPTQVKRSEATSASQMVTEVDLLSQKMILEYLQPTLKKYKLGLLAEENADDLSRLEHDYFWCIDPLDGTLPFVEHRPGYAVSIALVSRSGESALGVVYDPLTRTLYHAIQKEGVFRNQKAWKLTKGKSNAVYKTIDKGGAVMNACWVLENAPACFYKLPKLEQGSGCLWDYAATSCLYQEIGAWVSDISGNPIHLNQKDSLYMNHHGILFASHPDIAKIQLRK